MSNCKNSENVTLDKFLTSKEIMFQEIKFSKVAYNIIDVVAFVPFCAVGLPILLALITYSVSIQSSENSQLDWFATRA